MILRPLKVQPCWRKKQAAAYWSLLESCVTVPSTPPGFFALPGLPSELGSPKWVAPRTSQKEYNWLEWQALKKLALIEIWWNLINVCRSLYWIRSLHDWKASETPSACKHSQSFWGTMPIIQSQHLWHYLEATFKAGFSPEPLMIWAFSRRIRSQLLQLAACATGKVSAVSTGKKIHDSDKTQLAKSCEEISVTVSIHYWHLKGLGRLKTW